MDFWLIFLTGLTVGGLSCLAVQGGLLASTIAAREEEDIVTGIRRKHSFAPTLAFILAKLIAYILFGFALGAFGSILSLSDQAKTTMQLIAGVYMILVALNLLNVHPIFRYVIIQPPRFLTRLVRNQAKSKDLFAPAFLGAMTVFIPCGTTVAMEALAISSGSPILGALTMGVFVLGTSPLFFGIGYITSILGDALRMRFMKIAGLLVLYLGITSANGSLVLAGSPITLQTLGDYIPISINLSGPGDPEVLTVPGVNIVNGVQTADISVFPAGYEPNYVQVKSGVPVRLNLSAKGGIGCTSAFVIPQLRITKQVPRSGSVSVDFTPNQVGKLTWTCSMGMYYGTIDVI